MKQLRGWMERWWWVPATLLLIGLLGVALITRRSIPLWPGNAQWKPDGYSDEPVGGQCRLLEFRNDGSTLLSRFTLSDSVGRYAGLVLNPADGIYKDCSRCTDIRIKYRTLSDEPLRVELLLDVPGRTQLGAPLTKRYLYWPLPPSTSWREIRISLSEFQTQEWWFRKNFISPEQLPPPDFSRFMGLALCESEFSPPWRPLGVELRAAVMEGPWWPVILAALLIPVPGLLHQCRKRFRKPPKVKPHGKPRPVLPREDLEFDHVVQMIAEKYCEPELSLAMVQRETGIPENRISALLDKRTGLYFKPYLNQVRINEACRLLTESDLTVAEIAFQVGYSNTTHFNRVFKLLKQVSPGEYRRISANPGA